MSYQDFKVVVAPRGPFLTPLMADTLWGHVVCRLAEEGDVSDWVTPENARPPLLLTDVFPEGWLPAPAMAASTAMRQDDMVTAAITRRALKQGLMSDELVTKLLAAPDNMEAVLAEAVRETREAKRCPLSLAPEPGCEASSCPALSSQSSIEDRRRCAQLSQSWRVRPPMHPSRHLAVSRQNLTALEGQLFDLPDTWLGGRWVLWARTTIGGSELHRLLGLVGETGYGARSAVGKGHFVVETVDAGPNAVAPVTPSTRLMTLSSCLPATTAWSRQALQYRLRVKHGKRYLSSEFIKRPVAMFRAGSVFQADGPTDFVGSILTGVHATTPEIVDCGLAYPVWF